MVPHQLHRLFADHRASGVLSIAATVDKASDSPTTWETRWPRDAPSAACTARSASLVDHRASSKPERFAQANTMVIAQDSTNKATCADSNLIHMVRTRGPQTRFVARGRAVASRSCGSAAELPPRPGAPAARVLRAQSARVEA